MKFYRDYQTLVHALNVPVIRNDDCATLSFTPYIYNSCSANCRFCSERLSRSRQAGICQNVCTHYGDRLTKILDTLSPKTIFLSLSGKEPTESPQMLKQIAEKISQYRNIHEKVMYSNLSGFCKYDLEDTLKQIGLTRIECSRHHFDQTVNQSIMRFNQNETIQYNAVFSQILKKLSKNFNMRMVCVFQKSGIADYDDILQYLAFAKSLGIHDVVFRELAVFDKSIHSSPTAYYIAQNRIDLSDILVQLDISQFLLRHIIQGYYYYSFAYTFEDMSVCFEMSDYEQMEQFVSSGHLPKLILYPDGQLCTNWR